MDKVKDLLTVFLKISAALFIIVLVLMFSSLVPKKNTDRTSTASSTVVSDILPSPRKYSGFFSSSSTKRGIAQAPVFTAPNAFSYNGAIAFSSSSGNPIGITNSATTYTLYSLTEQQGRGASQETGAVRNLIVRNLSIYEGSSVYTGFSFVGEARTNMFREGKFPIIIVDASGKVIGVSAAVAQTSWAVPGWARFETRITYALPDNVKCTMIFEEALNQTERTRQPVQIGLPIRCN